MLGVPHINTQDDEYRGWLIPKGTLILTNFHAIHMDPARYESPEKFLPERHMANATTSTPDLARGRLSERDNFAYGAGRRICAGMDLADSEIRVATAIILWATKVELVRDENGVPINPPD